MAHAGSGEHELRDFVAVFQSEIESINKRRARLRELDMSDRPDITLEPESASDGTLLVASDETTPQRPTAASEIVGLALSGGGIRSAAFSLGVLQALYSCGLIRKIDYLSTVSGGGYIGTSLTAGMTANEGHFPFASYLSEDETPSLQHVRDYSNYLFPNGAQDVLSNLAVYVRGLIANSMLVLPFLLLAAIVTIHFHPIKGTGAADYFKVSEYIALVFVGLMVLWAIVRSYMSRESEAPGYWSDSVGVFIVLLLFVFVCQLQPFILDAMFAQKKPNSLESIVGVVQKVIIFLAPVATAFAFIAHKFGEVIKSALESEKVHSQISGYAAKIGIYIAGAIVPLLLWIIYLQFVYWGMCMDKGACTSSPMPHWLWSSADTLVGMLPADLASWMKLKAANVLPGKHAVIFLYLVVSLVCLAIMLFLRPNANSLHRLYRDRLSKAFMFQPERTVRRDEHGIQPPLAALRMKLSSLSETDAPYHLINTALNVQSSKEVNRRGRNADFFLLSRNYVGSRTTSYVQTRRMEAAVRGFDLGSAMAVSGAAVSSNMGSATIKPLTATIALLNIRLGYWLRNPRRVDGCSHWNRFANFYFLAELFGLLNEKYRSVYLSDGGHIENLGLYELLRRRCQVIIVVDAEADPQMAFGAFNVVERYALIDLGVRIDLPWQQIANESKKAGDSIDKTGDAPKHAGPHVAVGQIRYPGGRNGVLVYIKSSLTGDENDYVFHYKKRYGAFPHETTLDQLFTEEQFEAYRALGFHAAYRFFDRRDGFAYPDPAANPCFRDQLAVLDRLFPVSSEADPCAPRPYETFAGRLAAEMAKAKAEEAKRAAAESCCADLAAAAGRVAVAAQTAAGVLAEAPAATG